MTIEELLKSLGIGWDHSVISLDTKIMVRVYGEGDSKNDYFTFQPIKVSITDDNVIVIEAD